MIIKAVKSFCGVISLGLGQIAEVDDDTAKALIRGGYAKEYKGEDKKALKEKEEKEPAPVPKKKAVRSSGNK